MSRWSKRSQEEKEQILKSQEQQQKEKETNIDKLNYLSIDWRMKLLKEGELPLMCGKHGWVHSEKYILILKKDMFGKHNYIVGTCPKCNKKLECMVPLNMVYTSLYPLVMATLVDKKRLEDRR